MSIVVCHPASLLITILFYVDLAGSIVEFATGAGIKSTPVAALISRGIKYQT